ncbi:MAG: hypothetical protein ACLTWK_00585 [Eisenbergiella sp.]
MSLLTKLGILEEVPKNEEAMESNYVEDVSTPLADAEIPDTISETLIDDIYSENGISGLEKSIYKVEMFANTLPKEMPQATQATTVLGILAASGIAVADVLNDADIRRDVLRSVKSEIDGNNNEKILEAESKIEALKSEIEELNSEIYNAKVEMNAADNRIEEEISKIDEMVKFVSAMGGDKK